MLIEITLFYHGVEDSVNRVKVVKICIKQIILRNNCKYTPVFVDDKGKKRYDM